MNLKEQSQLILKFFKQTKIKAAFCVMFVGSIIAVQPFETAAQDPTLWVVDDWKSRVYHLTLGSGDPTLISSFPTVRNAKSSIAVDTSNDTLWGLTEKPGLVVNFSKSGKQLTVLDFESKFPGREPEAVTVDFFNDTLWVVDDPVASRPNGPRIYNFTKDGELIDSFATAAYDGDSVSPQSITVDPFDGSLWLTDNTTDKIYNITTVGQLVKSVSTRKLSPRATQPQGISIDGRNGSVWITDRNDHIYNVQISASGEMDQLGSFLSVSYDQTSGNPTGIAFDPGSVDISPVVPAPGHSSNNGFVDLRNMVEKIIDAPDTPIAVADALENTVLGYIQLAFEENLKGDPDDLAEQLETAIENLESIAIRFSYDTLPLQNEVVCLSIAQAFNLLQRVQSIVSPQATYIRDGQALYDLAVKAWRESDFTLAAKQARRSADKIEHPVFAGDFCPAAPSSGYHLQLCEIQAIHNDVASVITTTEDVGDKLKLLEARDFLRSGLEKFAIADVRSATRRFRDACRRLDRVHGSNVTPQLARLAKQVSQSLVLFLDDADASGHSPERIEQAYNYFDTGETARKNGQYVKAVERFKSAATLARPLTVRIE